ncbi:MAG: hypothetical protein D6730_18890 [Bacteroidetes bacterium]|nr:MAG: hypothetical protein D6730_18890 [Bacteroidota bacterium]
MLLNFKADSYPHWGAIALVLAIGLSVLAWWQEGKSSGAASKAPNWKQAYSLTAWWLLLLVGASGCSPQPRPIQYGKDACAFCQMTIVDQRYGTELVSKTGKVYTFDSIECLVQYLQQGKLPKEEVYQSLLTDFNQPGQLIEAGGSYVLFSPDLPSPMGMYLTAFADPAEARTFLEEHPGKLFDWQALQRQFDSLAQEVRSSKIN